MIACSQWPYDARRQSTFPRPFARGLRLARRCSCGKGRFCRLEWQAHSRSLRFARRLSIQLSRPKAPIDARKCGPALRRSVDTCRVCCQSQLTRLLEAEQLVGIDLQEQAHLADIGQVRLDLSALVARVAVLIQLERLGERACGLEAGTLSKTLEAPSEPCPNLRRRSSPQPVR